MEVYITELATIESPDREAVMQIINEWEARGEPRGEARGEVRGKADIVIRQLRVRYGEHSEELKDSISALAPATLEAMAEAMYGFSTLDDGIRWVADRSDVPASDCTCL